MKQLAQEIQKLGEILTNDTQFYEKFKDVACDPKKGIIPRGLILEIEKRDNHPAGCVMVGLNPGQASAQERKFFVNGSSTYGKFLEHWRANISDRPYYKRLREFASAIGLRGPILWTELVKCQSRVNGKLNVSTIRADIHEHLFKELEVMPSDWPIIGVGYRAFEILAYSFPRRLIIGVPHPTGSFGQFHKLFKNGQLKSKESQYLKKILRWENPIAAYYKCSKNKCAFIE